jgi:NADH-quinone oxidoreductase subunit C
MLLAKIKEALDSLYDDIREAAGAAAAAEPETVPEAEAEPEVQPEAAADELPQDAEATGEAKEDSAEAVEEVPEEPAPPIGPQETDYQTKGYHLDVELLPAKVVEAVEILNSQGFFIVAVTGVDWIDEQQLEVVYDFNHFDELCRVVVRARLDRENPEIPTISHIYQGANWHERETHDFFGIKFTDHPDLSPLLLPEDADFHPLLKDFTP